MNKQAKAWYREFTSPSYREQIIIVDYLTSHRAISLLVYCYRGKIQSRLNFVYNVLVSVTHATFCATASLFTIISALIILNKF